MEAKALSWTVASHGPGAGFSPLPRPVLLSSQVGPRASPLGVHSGSSVQPPLVDSPIPFPKAVSERVALPRGGANVEPMSRSVLISISPREGRSTPYPRGSMLIPGFEEGDSEVQEGPAVRPETVPTPLETAATGAAEEAAMEMSPLGTRDSGTVTVSPQSNAVVYTAHSRLAQPLVVPPTFAQRKRDRGETEDGEDADLTPRRDSRRSRVLQTTPDTAEKPAQASANTTAEASPEESTPPRSGRSSGGRRSEVERLLQSLPPEVVAEVQQIEAFSPDSTPASQSSASAAQSPSGATIASNVTEWSSISRRVGQRPRERTAHDDAYYLTYLSELARTSAKKVRKAAAKRVHQRVVQDVTHGKRSPLQQSTRTSSGSSRAGGRSSDGTSPGNSPRSSRDEVEVSPMTPSPRQQAPGGGASGLKVTTRLSAELRTALFKDEEGGEAVTPSRRSRATPAKDSTATLVTGEVSEAGNEPGSDKRKSKKKMLKKKTKKAKKALSSDVKAANKKEGGTAAASPPRPEKRTKAGESPASKKDQKPVKVKSSSASPLVSGSTSPSATMTTVRKAEKAAGTPPKNVPKAVEQTKAARKKAKKGKKHPH